MRLRKLNIEGLNNYFVQRPYTDWERANGIKFNSRRFFNESVDARQFLDMCLIDQEYQPIPYVEVTGHGLGREQLEGVCTQASDWARWGMKVNGESYKFLYGQWRDHLTQIFVPADLNLTWEHLGVHIKKPDEVQKRIGRLIATHMATVRGVVNDVDITQSDAVISFTLEDGYSGTWRVIFPEGLDQAKLGLVDGQMRISSKFSKHVLDQNGIHVRNVNTYAGKATVFGPVGIDKGYAHNQAHLDYDIVSYGPKDSVTYDHFFFGYMGDLNPGRRCRLDLQSGVNFELESFMEDAFEDVRTDIHEALRDEDKFRATFLNSVAQRSNTTWVLPRALKMGLSYKAEPGILRRVARKVMQDLADVARFRIPFDKMACRVDMVPDPNVFDEFGRVIPENSIIPAGYVCCMDIPEGLIAAYRQPNGHALEHFRVINKHYRQLSKYAGRHVMFLGPDAFELLDKVNGGDMDDTVVAVFGKKIVSHFYSLSYHLGTRLTPSEAGPKIVNPAVAGLIHAAGRAEPIKSSSYTVSNFLQVLADVQSNDILHLGQIVNTIMLDTCLSGKHKIRMLADLDQRIQDEKDPDVQEILAQKYLWLKNRPEYMTREAATNLDYLIDYSTQRKGDRKQLDPLLDVLKDIRANTEVYPEFFGASGTGMLGRGRLPMNKVQGIDFVLAKCHVDDVLDRVKIKKAELEDAFRRFEWECITPVSIHLDNAYPFSGAIRNVALGLYQWWRVNVMWAHQQEDSGKAFKEITYGHYHECNIKTCPPGCKLARTLETPGLEQRLKDAVRGPDGKLDQYLMQCIAVDLKRIGQSRLVPIVTEEGLYRGVPDSSFSNDLIFNIYLDALEEQGLAGEYEKVDFDGESRHLAKLDNLEVEIDQEGRVYRRQDSYWIGTVTDCPEGYYQMAYGYVCVADPDESITAGAVRQLVDTSGELPRAKEVVELEAEALSTSITEVDEEPLY